MMEQLFQRLADANLIDEMDNIILGQFVVGKDSFMTYFGDVSDDPTYEALSGPHTFTLGEPPQQMTYTAAQLGYQEYFDQWKGLGIL